MDSATITFFAALIGAFLVILGAIVLASFLNRGAATREAALLSALESERKARAEIEQQREVERLEARKYRDATDRRMASMETELSNVKQELALVKAQREIERATFMNLIRSQNRKADFGYLPDVAQSEDNAMRDWIAQYFQMNGDMEILASNAGMQAPPADGGASTRAQWLVTYARTNGLSGNLAEAAKRLRPRIEPW